MRTAFWISLFVILYTYAGYPLLIWLLARLRPKPWTAKPINPSVSIVLAVHNGIALLGDKIQHLLGLDYPNIREIIIVSDGSTDGTAELLSYEADPRFKSIVLSEHAGKAVAVNAGASAATGEIVVFVDIRPEIAPGSIQQLISNFADPTVGCANGELSVRKGEKGGASAAIGGLYWRYENWIRKCECSYWSPVGVYGGYYAVRRELLEQQPAGMILDDMFQPLSIVRKGFRVVLDPKAHVYDRWPDTIGREFNRKVRTLAGNFQLFQMMPWTLTPRNPLFFQLVSHKLMRLVVPYMLFALLISTLALSRNSHLYAAAAVFQILGITVASVGMRYRIPVLHRVAGPLGALFVLNLAAIVGLYKFLVTRGPLWKIWTAAPAPPSRFPRDSSFSRSPSGTQGRDFAIAVATPMVEDEK